MFNISQQPVVAVNKLSKSFSNESSHLVKKNNVKVLNDVSFFISKGETLGLVGESGSGKTTIGKILSGIEVATSGQFLFNGKARKKNLTKQEHRDIQMIFQDPYSSLNPRHTVKEILGAPLLFHQMADKSTIEHKIFELLEKVSLPKSSINSYPHEFSGGQRQRIGIARAVSLEPQFIICDEPVSALDMSIQAQILNLLREIQKTLSNSMLFIGHDLGAVSYISDRVAVIYQGEIVEIAETTELFNNPLHDYTKMLLAAIPNIDPTKRTLEEFDYNNNYYVKNSKFVEVSPGHFVLMTSRKSD